MTSDSLRDRQRQLREDAILDAAHGLLTESGYAEMNMNELAARLGISKATLYQHFPSKEELAVAVAVREFSRAIEMMSDRPPGMSAFQFWEERLRFGLSRRLMFGVAAQGLMPATVHQHQSFRAQHRKMMAISTALIEEAQADGDIAAYLRPAVIVRTVQGLFGQDYSDLLTQLEVTPEQLANELVTMLLDGVRGGRRASNGDGREQSGPDRTDRTDRARQRAGAARSRKRAPKRTRAALGLLMTLVCVALPAHADQPASAGAQRLEDFLAAARAQNVENREQAALVEQTLASREIERAALLPALTASASYTRNQRETRVVIPDGSGGFDEAVITPLDQLDASVSVSVPLIDVGAWKRLASSATAAEATRANAEATRDDVDQRVARAYYQWVGGSALVRAARVAEEVAVQNLRVVEGRAAAGFASELDIARATAEVAKAQQSVADAELTVVTARRTLVSLTGLEPGGDAPALSADVSAEAALERWLDDVDALPQVRAAALQKRADEQAGTAAWLDYVPTVGLLASERVTNAAGFGEKATWSAAITATWRLDLGARARARASTAAARVGAVRVERMAQDARDRIIDAWNQIEAQRARATAAQAEVSAARKGLDVARNRFEAGGATQLEVVQAQRDAFRAEVALVQAQADLAFTRTQLRMLAGKLQGGVP